jgi:glycosyltransferase involved in cell wall biosynthesis
MRRIIHLIPYDGIGGVEEAARSMAGTGRDGMHFEVRWLFPAVRAAEQRRATNNPLRILRVGVGLARERPDTLIVSLWRAVLAGCIARLLSRRIRFVLFLHNSEDAHLLDRFVTRFAAWLADEIWADSEATVRMRFGRPPRRPVKVISFTLRRLAQIDAGAAVVPRPVLVFWGRLAAQKNLSRALGIFARIRARCPDAEFRIIGPDGDEAETLRARVRSAGFGGSVRFLGALPFERIAAAARGASFYLQTSTHEGMAISVTEAMQMGLVPVVTPVGEIARYCRNGENAVLIQDDGQAAEAVLALLASPRKYQEIRQGAIREWQGATLYPDAVFDALGASR